MAPSPVWSDDVLRVTSDSRWRAQYRLLQSWYRETVLHEEPAVGANAKLVGSMLSDAAGAAGKNFLSRDIAAYVERRIPEVQQANGTIEVTRLRQNMLSSQPLCFNLFGSLRQHPVEAAALLKAALGLDVAKVETIECEWAPENGIGDRTAFDAFVEYRTSSGARAFLGVETKFTEPFSTTEYESDVYTARTNSSGVFREGAAAVLKCRATNQLWRNALLALSLRRTGYTAGHAVVVSCKGDAAAEAAVRGVREQVLAPDDLVRHVALEDLIEQGRRLPVLEAWAGDFRRRYLDLSPVLAALGSGQPHPPRASARGAQRRSS